MKKILVWGLANYRGGTESVIYNYAKSVSPSLIHFDFLCYETPEIYNSLFTGDLSNNNYYTVPIKIKHPIKNAYELNKFFANHGNEYDAFWFNINDISNIDPLVLAERFGIKRRIVHMHSSDIAKQNITQIFSRLNHKRCCELATDRWACSPDAGRYLFGDEPFRVIPNLIDSEKYKFDPLKRSIVRRKLGINDSFVIGTVGRLSEIKNSKFLIELLPTVLKKKHNAKLVFVGDGAVKERLIVLADELGISDRVIFAGVQDDTQAYYSSFDVFALPSLHEGLPLVMLEAQFNRLPCVTSLGVSTDCVISESVKRVDCSDMATWADELVSSSRDDMILIDGLAKSFDISNASKTAESLFL